MSQSTPLHSPEQSPKQTKSNALSRRAFLRFAGAGAVTIAIVSCSSPSSSTPAASTSGASDAQSAPSAAARTLVVQGNPTDEQGVADSFSEKFPDATVEFISVTGIDHEEVASKILSMVAAGQRFDLGGAATEANQLYAGQGLSVNMREWVERDAEELRDFFSDCHPSLIEAMMFEDGLYMLPQNFNAANMYYNTAMFEQAGIERPADDWTNEDFLAIASQLATGAGTANQTYGYGWTNRLWGSWMPFIFSHGANLTTEERAPGGEWMWGNFYADDPAAEGRGGGWRWLAPQANNAANVEALQVVVDMIQQSVSPTVELGGGDTLQGFFTANKMAMTPAGGFWAKGLSNAGMANGSFDVMLWPKAATQRHQFGTGGKFIFQQSQEQDLAWDYCKHTVSIEGMRAFYVAPISTPTRRSFMNAEFYAETGPEHWQVFQDTLDKHPSTSPIPAPPCSNPMTTTFTKFTGLATNGEMTPQAALDGMQTELLEIFERAGDMYNLEG